MDARNLTELLKANDDNKPNHADNSGGITIDVLPTRSVLFGTLKIRVLEQMPRWGNSAHSHFLPLLPSAPSRPRVLPQQPHTMNKPNWKPSELDKAMAKLAKARERELAKATGSKNQPRRNR